MSTGIDQAETLEAGDAIARFRAAGLIETTLDMLPIGIVLVDAGIRIVHRNAAALQMLNTGEPIVSHSGHLRATCKDASAGLVAAASCVMRMGGEGILSANASIPLPYSDGRAAVAHVRPLTHATSCLEPHREAAVAIFIAETTDHAPLPFDALMTLFDLTRTETRVIEQIVMGRNRRETAKALGVADSTVKTHLERIFSKTGTSDQLGLCRLMTALSWPAGRITSTGKD